MVGLSDVRWPGKGEIVSENYTMFYSSGIKVEKGVVVVLRNDVVKSNIRDEMCAYFKRANFHQLIIKENCRHKWGIMDMMGILINVLCVCFNLFDI